MTRNMGTADRAARIILATPLAVVLAAVVGFASPLGIVLLAVGGIMLSTGAAGLCPLYLPFGLSTVGRSRAHA